MSQATRMPNSARIIAYTRQPAKRKTTLASFAPITSRQMRRIRKNINKNMRDIELDAIEELSKPLLGNRLPYMNVRDV